MYAMSGGRPAGNGRANDCSRTSDMAVGPMVF
jgi:hypothetical protein